MSGLPKKGSMVGSENALAVGGHRFAEGQAAYLGVKNGGPGPRGEGKSRDGVPSSQNYRKAMPDTGAC